MKFISDMRGVQQKLDEANFGGKFGLIGRN